MATQQIRDDDDAQQYAPGLAGLTVETPDGAVVRLTGWYTVDDDEGIHPIHVEYAAVQVGTNFAIVLTNDGAGWHVMPRL